MTSNAITEKQEGVTDRPLGSNPQNKESAPSLLREDQTGLPRTLGMIGAALVIFGGMALAFNLYGRAVRVSTGWSLICLSLGMCGLLYHAAFDRDIQFRRLYMTFGFVTLVLGLVLGLLPYPKAMGDQLRWGVVCLSLSLMFFLAFLRNEEEAFFRDLVQKVIGFAGLTLAVFGLIGGTIRGELLLPLGLVFSVLGLVYLTAFVGSRGISCDLAYYSSFGIAGLGGFIATISVIRSLMGEGGSTYFVSYGFLLLNLGLLYILVVLGMALDWPVFVMTRRELGAFFYSPIAYLALLGFSVCWWGSYWTFLSSLFDFDPRNPPIEPIVRQYYFALVPVITLLALVPALTMRLLSEEMRSGTMEVMLTAPVNEPTIVLSKFFATLIVYMVMWLPSGLLLLAIPLSGGNAFDYRPMLSFLVVVLVTGAGFVSMGLFFSSLTKSQIASFVFTFAGMTALMVLYFGAHMTRDDAWKTVLTHMSFLDLWFNTLDGKITPRFLLFPLSMTVLFLFMTVKVLESRKWR